MYPCMIGEQQCDETERIFFEHSVHKQSPLYYAAVIMGQRYACGNDANYQYYKAVNNAKREHENNTCKPTFLAIISSTI